MSSYRYRQYRSALKALPPMGQLMPYNWGTLPQTLSIDWIAYSDMFNEFSRELANIINSLTRYTRQLAAWRDVVVKLDNKGRHDVALEFVDPVATIALNLPYVIRSRFIFASAHLSHQAARAKLLKAWKDDLPLDDEIYFAQAEAAGRPWRNWPKLKTKLERIGDKQYQTATKNFRNTYNHRFSPRIVLGHTNFVTRQVDPATKHVRYGFGVNSPLTLEVVVALIEAQCDHCYGAFEAFQKLVTEQEQEVTKASNASLA